MKEKKISYNQYKKELLIKLNKLKNNETETRKKLIQLEMEETKDEIHKRVYKKLLG